MNEDHVADSRGARSKPIAVTIVGRSGSGKTTLCAAVVERLGSLGLRCGAIKHSGHRLDLDTNGKDSARLREAGGSPTVVIGPQELAWFADSPPDLQTIIGLMADVDVVLIEGFRDAGLPTILLEGEESASLDSAWSDPSGDILLRMAPCGRPDWPGEEQVSEVVALIRRLVAA